MTRQPSLGTCRRVVALLTVLLLGSLIEANTPTAAASQAAPAIATTLTPALIASARVSSAGDDSSPGGEDAETAPCDKTAGLMLSGGGLALTLVPPYSLMNPFVALGTALSIVFYLKCFRFAPDGSRRTVLTLDYLLDEVERIAGREIEKSKRAEFQRVYQDLEQTFRLEVSNLENLETMTPAERQRAATILQTIGNDASMLEAGFKDLSWEALPILSFMAVLKNVAYATSYSVTEEDGYRQFLVTRLMPTERRDSIDLLATKEAELVRFVRNDLVMHRSSYKYDGVGLKRKFETHADTLRDGETLYRQRWYCETKRPKGCNNFESRRSEFFAAAREAHGNARAAIAQLLTPEYLEAKAAMDTYRGAPFQLTNNRGGRCLDVADGSVAAGIEMRQVACDLEVSESSVTEQVWRFGRASGQLEHLRSGLCLDVAGDAQAQTDGSSVELAECADSGDVPADQEWGVHPLGYLVNMAARRCLDLEGAGAEARVRPCRYDLGPGVGQGQDIHYYQRRDGIYWYDFLLRPARGGSTGSLASDPATHQTWALAYLGTPLSAQVPAAPPTNTLPIAVDDTVTAADVGRPATIDVLANDPAPEDEPKRVVAVTNPAHGSASIDGSGASVTYTPQAGFCGDATRETDAFVYTLNGGSTATVTVTCRTVDQAPVAVDDATTVAQDSASTTVAVLGNDTDVDGGAKRVVAVADPAHGTATLGDNGASVSYQPDPGYCNDPGGAPVDEFSYTLSGGSTATVAVTVTCADTTAPATEITTRANIFGQTVFGSHKGQIAFRSPDPSATFECSLDGAPFRSCTSPADLVVSRGRHKFEVRAIDPAGNVDATPALRVISCTALF